MVFGRFRGDFGFLLVRKRDVLFDLWGVNDDNIKSLVKIKKLL